MIAISYLATFAAGEFYVRSRAVAEINQASQRIEHEDTPPPPRRS